MRVSLEVKEGDKSTRYVADLSKMVEPAEKVVEKIGSFLERAFEGVFIKETSEKEE